MDVKSDFSGGAKTGFGCGLDSTCESSLSDDHVGFVGVEAPGANREGVEPLHAPNPPDEGVMEGADDVGDSNEV